MPRFDHMKGSLRQEPGVQTGGKTIQSLWRSGHKIHPDLLQPLQSWMLKQNTSYFPMVPHPRQLGGRGQVGREEFRSETAGVKEALELSHTYHIEAEAQVKNSVDSYSNEKNGVRGLFSRQAPQLRQDVAAQEMGQL